MSRDLTGMRSGSLVAVRRIEHEPTKYHGIWWLCKCDCGNEKIIRSDHIVRKETISCGCKHYEWMYIHRKTHTRLHEIWMAMKMRCSNPNAQYYHRYGGRGIRVCDEWESDFQAFYDWSMANGYSDDLSIDRIDNDKGYSPDNCRWATIQQQARNKRQVIKVMYEGKERVLCELAEEYGLNPDRVYTRVIIHGWSVADALTLPKWHRPMPKPEDRWNNYPEVFAKWKSGEISASEAGRRLGCNGKTFLRYARGEVICCC